MSENQVKCITTGRYGHLISLSVNKNLVVIEWLEMDETTTGQRCIAHREEYSYNANKPLFRVYQGARYVEW